MLWPPGGDHGNNISAGQNQHDTFGNSTVMGNKPETETHVEGERLLACPAVFCHQLHHHQNLSSQTAAPWFTEKF